MRSLPRFVILAIVSVAFWPFSAFAQAPPKPTFAMQIQVQVRLSDGRLAPRSALEKAIQQDPKAVEAYFQLGTSLIRQNDSAGAVKALNQGPQLNPDPVDAAAAHYELARAYMALGQWQEANPHAAKAVAMQPDVATWHILMGNIDLKKGDGQGAINEFQVYLKLEPDGPAAASVRGMIPKIQTAMQKH